MGPTTSGHSIHAVSIVVLLFSLAAPPGASRSEERLQGQTPTPTLRSQATYVLVDAIVTDKEGRFVRGLGKEDFQVSEDGQACELDRVDLVDLALPDTAEGQGTGASGVFYLVVDDLHVRPERTPVARQIAEEVLHAVVRGDSVAAVVFTSGRGDLRGLTRDRDRLVETVRRAVGKKIPSAALGMAVHYDADDGLRASQARAAIETMAAIARSAASIPGRRKALILISEGIDIVAAPAREVVPGANEMMVAPIVPNRADLSVYAREVVQRTNDMIAVANRANVSIYAFDPRGAVGRLSDYAETVKLEADALRAEEKRSQEGLQELAGNTDGFALVNTSNFGRAYQRIRDDTSRYYLLAYRAGATKRGYHRIDVRVTRPGLAVRARRGYDDRLSIAVVVPGLPPTAVPGAASPDSLPTNQVVRQEPVPAQAPQPTESLGAMPGPPAPAPAVIPSAAPAASVEGLVQRAGQALLEYAEQLSLVIGIEHYAQYMGDTGFSRAYPRLLVSEFALVRVKDDWLGFRDVYEVDGKPVGDRQDRLRSLFLNSGDSAVSQARLINDESARHNLGAMQRNFNVPTMALFFLQPSNAVRFRFRKDGEDKIDQTPVWKLRYEETKKPTIIRTSAGKDMPVKGTLWVDPVRGRVLKTHMELATEATMAWGHSRDKFAEQDAAVHRRVRSSVSITVTYAQNASMNMLLPSEMLETYEGPSINRFTGREEVSRVNARATYSGFKRFETSGRVVTPK